jgi:hypothetical protein
MPELKKSFAPYRNLSPAGQADLAKRPVSHIHESFQIHCQFWREILYKRFVF